MPPSPPPNRNNHHHQNRHILVERRSAPMRICEPCRRHKRPCNGVRPCAHCSEAHTECVYSVVSDLPRSVFTTSSARRLSSGSACETCRRRKTKCDGGSPCGFCASAGIECVNNSERRKRAMGIPTTTSSSIIGTNQHHPPDAEAIDRIEDRLRRIEELMTAFTPTTHSPLSNGGHSRMVRQHRHSVQGISVAKEKAELRTAYALKKKQRMSPPPPAFDTFTTLDIHNNKVNTSIPINTTTNITTSTLSHKSNSITTPPPSISSTNSSLSSSSSAGAAAAAIARYATPPNSNGSNNNCQYSPPARHASPSPPPPLSPTLMIRQSSTTTNPLTSSMLNLTLSPSSSTSSTSNNSSMMMAAPQSSMSTPAANIVPPTMSTTSSHKELSKPPSSSTNLRTAASHWSTTDNMTEWKIASSSMPSLMDQLSKRTFATSSAFNTTEYPPYPLSLTPPQSCSSPSSAVE
ncbi:hypothetical protein INT45_012444 [Circinella minor]|uniref:Zn(2)-C6 fungal-type domain-containing protein n=1 Tax=Circinella minor TaxID=1195481 RepID=A0A8H7RXE2_9FUNG|nr:hypothetical protein INT45_012444 [Circinella minor]